MPLFKPLTAPRTKRDPTQQDIYCPRCSGKHLKTRHTNLGGEGKFRTIRNEYECDNCGYKVEVKEFFPAINTVRE